MPLQLSGVGRNFGSTWAVRDVSLEVRPGAIAAILGANGAGKSTLLQLIAGWLPVATGRISIEGRTLRTGSSSVRRRLMLLDEPNVHGRVGDLICQAVDDYWADRPDIASEAADWFEQLGLIGSYRKYMSDLSKGQRYKVAMICLFIVHPHLWLLDEPFSAGLDANGLQILESEIRRHAARGGIVVFSSQWPEHANRLANFSFVLHEGRLILRQSKNEPIDPAVIRSSPTALAAVLSGLGRDE